MTIHDDELQKLIGTAVDPSQLKHFDADSIAQTALLRASRRRKTIIESALAIAAAVAASGAVFGILGADTHLRSRSRLRNRRLRGYDRPARGRKSPSRTSPSTG